MEYRDGHLGYFGESYMDTFTDRHKKQFMLFVGAITKADGDNAPTHLIYLDEDAQRTLRDELNESLGE